MRSTETATAQSLFKATLVFAATAAMLALSGRAPAQEIPAAPRAYAGEPLIRMRNADAHGLTNADRLAADAQGGESNRSTLAVRTVVNHDVRSEADNSKTF